MDHTGTSAAAPLAAGIVALALEAKYKVSLKYLADANRLILFGFKSDVDMEGCHTYNSMDS